MKKIGFTLIAFCISSSAVLAQVPGLAWVKNMGGPPDAIVKGTSLATDITGNVYTTGTFSGTVDFNPGLGTFHLTSNDYDGFISKVDASGNFIWAIQFGSDLTDEGKSIIIDAAGNVLVTGNFQGTVDFNPGIGVDELTSFGDADVVVLKLTPAGNFVFAKQIGGVDYDFGKAILTDATNNIYVTGGYSDVADFNPDESTSYELTSNGAVDAFIIKLDINGNFQWVNSYGGPDGDDYDNGESLAKSPSGEIYLAGHYGQGDSGYASVFVKKLDSNGTPTWEQEIGVAEGATVHSIRSDALGNIYYSGTFDGTADFNPLGTAIELEGPNSYLCKINSAGIVIWAKTLGFNSYVENANAMAIDINGNFFLSGFFQSTTFDVDPGPDVANLYTTSTDVGGTFLLKLDNAGDYVWAQSFVNPSGTGGFEANAITTDNAGNIYFVGGLSETMNFATGICLPNELTATSADLIVMKMNSSSIPATCFGVIEQPASSTIACQESSVFLTVLAAGAPRISYQWQKFIGSSFVDIIDQEADGEGGEEGYEGTDTPYLTVIGIENAGTGEFRCKISADLVSDVFSDVATLIYTGSAAIPYVVANSGCGPGQFMITASGGTEGDYKWYDQNGDVIDGKVNSTFTTPFISVPTAFSVSKSTAGCESDKVTVEVNTTACAPVPGLVWVSQPKTTTGSASIKEIALDAGGNLYAVGVFSGTVDFDSGPGTAMLTTADPDGQEHFLLKLTKDRNVVWVKSLNDTGYSLGMHISFDGLTSIYLSGGFQGTVDFDPGVPVVNLTSGGNVDLFVSRFDTDGNFTWARKIGGSTSSAFVGSQGIASDGNGVYLTGSFTGTIDFDPNAGTQSLSSAGSVFFSDIFISKLDATGNYAWAVRMGKSSASDGGRDIKVDATGNVYTIGTYSGTVDFDPGATVFNLVGQGATDLYIHKLSNTGIFQWAKTITSPGVELPTALALDASGNPHITGTFGTIVAQPSVDFDPAAGVMELFSNQGIVFILKLDVSGNFNWAKNFGATYGAEPNDITIDDVGNVLIIGTSEGNPDWDPGAGTYSIRSNVNRDVFVSKLDASGNFSWAYNMGSTGLSYFNSEAMSILTDTEGSIYTAGSVSYSADLDPGHCTFAITASYSNGAFIQKIKPGVMTLCFNLQPISANACTGVPATFSVAATGTTNITYQWQKLNTTTSLYEDINDTGGYSGTATPDLVINTNGNFGAGDYKCLVSGDLVPDKYSEVASLIVSPNNAPSTSGNSGCAGSIVLSASGGTNGQYRWYSVATGGVPLGETNDQFTTPELSVTTTYYVAFAGACETTRTPVIATVLSPPRPAATGASICSSGTLTLIATGGSNGQYRWYDIDTGGIASDQTTDSYITPSLTSTTTYYVSLDNGTCESARTAVNATIVSPVSPTVTNASICSGGPLTLHATGGSDGQYRWYEVETGGVASDQTNGSYLTPTLISTTTYYVSIDNGTCEGERTPVVATVLIPTLPTVTGASICSGGVLTLSATGGSPGQYRWYDSNTGGTASDQTTGSFVTPSLTSTTTYYASINDGTCESERVLATATIFVPPAKPIITSSILPSGGTISICAQPVTLTAANGFSSYKWSTGETTQSITINTSPVNNLSLIVIDANGCNSVASDQLQIITLASCINTAPSISTATLTATLEGSVSINLLSLISDLDNNLDPGSLRIVTQPTSGALATIDSNGNLLIDYKGISFSGRDRIGIEACDFSGVCSQQELTVDVVGEVVVYNGISPNGDGKNDFLILQYIEVLEETKNNKVSIFNRWGDVVFEATNYNNSTIVFNGQNKNGNELPSGNYFYRIDFEGNKESMTGYLTLKR